MVVHVPSKVQVGTVQYDVIVNASEWELACKDADATTGAYGLCDARLAKIYLNPQQAPGQMRLSLWHELLHATINTVSGAPYWTGLIKSEKTDGDVEERIIRTLEHATLAVLRDNPYLVKYLTEEEEQYI